MTRLFAVVPLAAAALLALGPAARTNGASGPSRGGGNDGVVPMTDCHGPAAHGSETGANLIRSNVDLKYRFGSELGPFLKKSHPLQSKKNSAISPPSRWSISPTSLNSGLTTHSSGRPRGSTRSLAIPSQAKAYFNGERKCTTCHARTEGGPHTLFAIGAKYPDSVNLQQALLGPVRVLPSTWELDGSQYILVGSGYTLYAFTLAK